MVLDSSSFKICAKFTAAERGGPVRDELARETVSPFEAASQELYDTAGGKRWYGGHFYELRQIVHSDENVAVTRCSFRQRPDVVYSHSVEDGMRRRDRRKMIHEQHHLEAAAYSVNTAVQSSTGSSPYEVVYGQLPRLGATLSLDTPVKVGRSIPRQTLCRNIREDARKRIERAQKVQKRYDRRRQQAPEYRIGDEVWVQRGAPSSSKKFGAKFEGPFVITERVGENTWRVRSQTFDSRADKRKRNDFPVHVSRLKNCIRRQT
ncbi:hypothetical protein HPB50_023527 [Hyalomma asiaticum]|uniref:Uncharacterized protein n=1 Tax=Hyalomma asiaticum TaxID=266040 RepID=A0ACB7RW20_HYAAI|nr:hypothetical protein HPB50_023527 [Hyalomma asiaticum]